jgi:hypothetical protein
VEKLPGCLLLSRRRTGFYADRVGVSKLFIVQQKEKIFFCRTRRNLCAALDLRLERLFLGWQHRKTRPDSVKIS